MRQRGGQHKQPERERWLSYEAAKRALEAEPLSAAEYEAKLRELVEELGI